MYEDVKDNEYLDLSKNNLHLNGVIEIFKDLSEDTMLKQVDLSWNILVDDLFLPKNNENFFKKFKYYLQKNKSLTAIDLAGNFLFYYHQHPNNEHVKSYERELTSALLTTKIKRIDLSDNYICGFTGREMDGFIYFLKNYMIKNEALHVRNSNLTSQGFQALTHCLGVYSSLTYLDCSDNLGGLDARGNPTSEGMIHFCKILSQTLHLRVLKIARNHLGDNELQLIANAVHDCPEFRDLDVSGNLGRYFCCRNMKTAIISHSIASGPTMLGFRELNISTNPIGDDGIKELCIAIRRTGSLRILRVANCGITEKGGQLLQDALSDNATITVVDVYGNLMSSDQESLVVAESQANEHIDELRENPLGVDADDLYIDMYLALARKLRFLEQPILQQLHYNPSFNRVNTELRNALHLLEPPPRQFLIQDIKEIDPELSIRLEKSKEAVRNANAAKKIHEYCIRWYNKVKAKKSLLLAVLEAQRKEKEMMNTQFDEDDDMMSYASSLENKSLRSGNV